MIEDEVQKYAIKRKANHQHKFKELMQCEEKVEFEKVALNIDLDCPTDQFVQPGVFGDM